MSKPTLQVGDIATTWIGTTFEVLEISGSKVTIKHELSGVIEVRAIKPIEKALFRKGSGREKLHRPAPEGLVQVWPEVKE